MRMRISLAAKQAPPNEQSHMIIVSRNLEIFIHSFFFAAKRSSPMATQSKRCVRLASYANFKMIICTILLKLALRDLVYDTVSFNAN